MGENINAYRKTFVMILGCILAAAGGIYYGVRVGMAFGNAQGRDMGAILAGVILFFLLVQLISDTTKRETFSGLYRILVWCSGLCVSMLVYGLIIMIPLDIVTAIINGVSSARISYNICAEISVTASAIITVVGVFHAKAVKTVHYTLTTDKFAGTYRIVQLSDLHLGSVVGTGQMRRAVEKTNSLHPDIVVITGDLVNHGRVAECGCIEKVEKELSKLQAKDGTAAITGNHDPKPDDPAFRDFLKKSGIRLLDNIGIQLDKVYVFGRSGNSLNGRPELYRYYDPQRKGTYSVVLDHYPDGSREASEEGADLFLAGHTHGGQYFPCNIIIRKAYRKKLIHGHSVYGKTDCVVSSGTGYFQIPIRVGTDSEVVCIDIKGTGTTS